MSDEAIAQAQQCIIVARTAYEKGDLVKAIRFCEKSLNFHHSTVAETLLQQYTYEHKHGKTTTTESTTHTTQTTQRRGSATKTTTTTEREEVKRVYTEDQALAAKAIKKLKNYYDILGLTRDSSDKDIKAAYRKLALQFHPDKNQAPEAEDAFKSISNAFQTLSDPQKRAYYDEHGEDEQARMQRQHSQHHAHYERDQDLTPEDIFNMFFNVRPGAQGGYTRRTYVYPRQRRRGGDDAGQQQQPASSLMQFIQFLPLILLLVFSFLSAPGGEDAPFSLDPGTSFPVQRTTRHSDISYYVNRNFASRYRDPRALSQIETQVEQHMFKRVEEECQRQKSEKKSAIALAKTARPDQLNELLQRAHIMPTPACTRLNEMHPAHRQGG